MSAGDGEVLVVLDVDRTVISGTAWYYACSTPGVLLGEDAARRFRVLNDRAHGTRPDLDDLTFRLETLQLIRDEDPQALSEPSLYRSGQWAADQLAVYAEPYAYLRSLQAEIGQRLRLVYLTSGYESFARGVINRVHARQRVEGISYRITGSSFGTQPMAVNLLDGRAKAAWLARALDAGKHIDLVADDQHHDLLPVERIAAGGGSVVRLVHGSFAEVSRQWQRFLDTHLRADSGHALMFGTDSWSLAPIDGVLQGWGEALARLTPAAGASDGVETSEAAEAGAAIGVLAIPVSRYKQGCEQLAARVGRSHSDDLLALLGALTHASGPVRMMRGPHFYIGAPTYLFGFDRPRLERWRQAVTMIRDGMRLLDDHVLGEHHPKLSDAEWPLVHAIVDQARNLASHAMDYLIRAAVRKDESLHDDHLDDFVTSVHEMYWSFVLGRPNLSAARDNVSWDRLVDLMGAADDHPFSIRELDDSHTLVLAALSLLAQAEADDAWPALAVDFLSGAIDLGYAVSALARLTRPDRPRIEVAHIKYSSKHRLGDEQEAGSLTYERLLCRMAPHQRANLDAALGERRPVLLVDNNAATFATIISARRVLRDRVRGDERTVRAAVATVFYDNARRFLAGADCEPLHPDWRTALDYRPVCDYVTAFATWRTSEKTRALHDCFGREALNVGALQKPRRPDAPVLKLCRVHNVADLRSALRAGASMIGIHAVSPKVEVYAADSASYEPIDTATVPTATRVPHHEVAGIRQMCDVLPEGITPVLVLEEVPSTGELDELVALFGLDRTGYVVQLQCRVAAEDVAALRAGRNPPMLCAVGAGQSDYARYLADLLPVLDPVRDAVLIDFSKHQPDLIMASGEPVTLPSHSSRFLATSLKQFAGRVLLAGDAGPDELFQRAVQLHSEGITVTGFDTQNSTEHARNEQPFRQLAVDGVRAQVRVRKNPDLLAKWPPVLGAFEPFVYSRSFS